MESAPFQVPRVRHIARHAFPRVLEGTIIPVALFILALHIWGVTGAITAGLVWTYSAIGVRLVTKRRIPGILMLGAMTLTARSIVTFATGSTFVYFLQPTLGTALRRLRVPRVGADRVARSCSGSRRTSARSPRPCSTHVPVRQIFLRLTLLWAAAQFANAARHLLPAAEPVGGRVRRDPHDRRRWRSPS